MSVAATYVLCECPEHGEVCAKRTGSPFYSYQCPGVEGDTDGCYAEELKPLGPLCERPAWAEYPDEHIAN
jgi:hypothetical protein